MADVDKIVVYYHDGTYKEIPVPEDETTVVKVRKKKLKETTESLEPQLLLEVEPKGTLL